MTLSSTINNVLNIRIRLLFNGGVSLDGLLPITPDRLDLVQVLDAEGNILLSDDDDTEIVLGLADLGPAPAPHTQCEKDNWVTDGDNYLDICLNIPREGDQSFTSLITNFYQDIKHIFVKL